MGSQLSAIRTAFAAGGDAEVAMGIAACCRECGLCSVVNSLSRSVPAQ
jgi:hypothetical protein